MMKEMRGTEAAWSQQEQKEERRKTEKKLIKEFAVIVGLVLCIAGTSKFSHKTSEVTGTAASYKTVQQDSTQDSEFSWLNEAPVYFI